MRLKRQKFTEEKPAVVSTLKIDELQYGRLSPDMEIELSTLWRFDALLLEDKEDTALLSFVNRLRHHPQPSIYLKPIFFLNPMKRISRISGFLDGDVVNTAALSDFTEEVMRINQAVRKVDTFKNKGDKVFKIALLDEDINALNKLAKQLTEFPESRIMWMTDSLEDAEERLQLQEHVDVLFCNIPLTKKEGIHFLKYIQDIAIPEVIVISDDEQEMKFALEIEFTIFGHLMKPISQLQVNQIWKRLSEKYQPTKEQQESDEQVFLKRILNYLYTRKGKPLSPISSSLFLRGYSFPMLSENADSEKFKHQMNILREATEQGYLETAYFDAIHSCSNCSGSLLHYRETCPKCKSSHLEQQNLIHHFRCAYVGPQSDFEQAGNDYDLFCPKCDKRLQHIGVDYDKPAEIFNCLDCGTVTQDPVIRAKCVNCKNDEPVEYLIKEDLFSYKITDQGTEIVENNRGFKEKRATDTSIEDIYFLRFLKKEMNRKKEVDTHSSLAVLNFHNLPSLYKTLDGRTIHQLRIDLYEILESGFSTLTEIKLKDPEHAFLIIPENKAEKVENLMEQVREKLTSYSQHNFDDFQTDISYKVVDIVSDKSPQEQIDSLTK